MSALQRFFYKNLTVNPHTHGVTVRLKEMSSLQRFHCTTNRKLLDLPCCHRDGAIISTHCYKIHDQGAFLLFLVAVYHTPQILLNISFEFISLNACFHFFEKLVG